MNVIHWLSRPALLFTAGYTLAALGAQAQKGHKALPLDTAVRTGKLPNGFTYYIRHNEEPKKRVTLYLVNKAGAILETEEQRGLAHFIEHMSFNGTTHFPKNELVNYLQKSGVRFGADLNAYTSYDETVYQLPLPTDNKELLDNGLTIMREWAQEATLDAAEIDKERGVILEEKRLKKGAQDRMMQQFFPVIMNHSRYADRMPIGIDTVLKFSKPETLREFYHDWYRPDLQALIVVGDIDVNEMEQVIKARFSTLVNPKKEKKRVKYTIPLTGKNQFLVVTDPEMPSTSIEIVSKFEQKPVVTEADYRNSIVEMLFNMMLSQRYSELGKQANPPFLKGGAGLQGFLGGLQIFGASAGVASGGLETGVKAVWRELERAKRLGFTQAELDRAKQDYLSKMAAAWKEKNKTGSDVYVKQYMQYFLAGTAVPGLDKEYQLVNAIVPGIAVADINAVLKTYSKNTDRDIIIMAPQKDKAKLPDEATVNGWLHTVEQEPMDAYKDVVADKPLLAAKPAAGKITRTEQITEVGVTKYTLSNGVTVLVKPTTFKNNEIGFTAFAPGGTSLYSDADYQSAVYAPGIIDAGGVGDYNSQQLDKYLSGKQLNVAPFISDRTQGFNGSAAPAELETMLQLVYLFYTAPRKDADLFQNIITRLKGSLANRASDPSSIYNDTVNAVLGNYNVRRTGPTLEKIDQINLDRAYAIYKERFADASNFTFLFVGSVDTAVLKPLLETYLGSLPATHKHEEARDLGIHIPAGVIERNVYSGKEDKATVRLVFSGDYQFSEENNSTLQALAKVINLRLLERLREEEGGVYTPNADVNFNKYPAGRYAFTIGFGCAPANVDKLIASALDEINKLKLNGPEEVNLDKYKAESRASLKTALESNGFWINYINSQYQNNEPLGAIYNKGKLLDAVTVQKVQQAAKDYLGGNNYIRLVSLPEKQ
ncbi:zinc protease [Filimonas lacunae]|uniref:Zinc protease n=1 Tax=Filimonas lacunae TaxID=477680 RepID=A0A173MD06_9BACT|nr:M16 family metallopeptidase [Filimonas lacunae]BAV05396.1 zinc protease PqqL [Filimonas lacunae]SIT21455.1 zinc protease [Filimonas lacunae]